MLYGPAISQSDCRKAGPYQLTYNNEISSVDLKIFPRQSSLQSFHKNPRLQGGADSIFGSADSMSL